MKTSYSLAPVSHFSSPRGRKFLRGLGTMTAFKTLAACGLLGWAAVPGANAAVLLSWDFAGNTGSETTDTADTIISTLGSGSGVLSRGAGLSTGANDDRFNATNWATTSIANAVTGNDYFEFSLNYNGTNSITIDTINFIWQRSGTGTTQLAIRSSLDSYASNLATFNVVDNTSSQTFASSDLGATFTGLTSNVTFRFYGFSEAGTGSGGFEGTGADLVVNGEMGVVAGPSLYFLGEDTTRGGSGTWANTGGTAWSATDVDGGSGVAWDSTKTAVFNGGSASTVTVSGTIDADKGLTFKTTGTTLSGGTAIDLGGATAADNSITTDSGVTATISTALTGSTGMTKAGLGILELEGNNSYGGGTVIGAGRLLLGHNSAAGTGTITMNGSGAELQLAKGLSGVSNDLVIANDGDLKTIRFYDSTDVAPSTYAGDITINESTAGNFEIQIGAGDTLNITGDIGGSGGAGLKKTGAGKLNLTGSNSYTGGTNVVAGTLVGNTSSLQGNLSVAASAIAEFDQASTGTYAGNISGSGSLVKSGAGNLTLSGTNSYSGGTTVSAGTLTGNAGSLQGAITNDSAVVFDQGTSGSHAGGISGSGSLTKTGAGNLTLNGTNSYGGGTTVSAGTLTGTTSSLQGDITNNAVVAITQGSTGTYAGDMTGTGSLAISGGGSVTLTGANGHSGGTSITASTAVLGSATALGSGAVTLESGTIDAQAGLTIGNAMTLKQSAQTQVVLGYWNFNGLSIATASAPGSGGVPTTITADLGGGTLSLTGWTGLVDDFAGSTINSLNGDAEGVSLSPVSSDGNGSYLQISGLDLSAYSGVSVSFATRGTSTGFNSGAWSYSTDGTAFTGFGSNTATTGTTYVLATPGSTSGLDAVSTGYLRYTLDGATSTTGNNRIDNLQITALSPGAMPVVGSTATSGTSTYSGGIALDGNAQLTAAGGGTVEFAGIIADGINGAKGITKIGAGTVVLSGNNTYDGATTVNAGTLVVNGNQTSATGAVTVNAGRLEGTGTLGGATTVKSGATHSPGLGNTGAVATDIQGFNGLTYESGSIFEWQLNSTASAVGVVANSGDYDKVILVTGALGGSGATFKIVTEGSVFTDGFWDDNKSWNNIFLNASSTPLAFESIFASFSGTGVAANGTVTGQGQFTINGSTLTWTAVPEPTSALAGLLLGAGLLRRRRCV